MLYTINDGSGVVFQSDGTVNVRVKNTEKTILCNVRKQFPFEDNGQECICFPAEQPVQITAQGHVYYGFCVCKSRGGGQVLYPVIKDTTKIGEPYDALLNDGTVLQNVILYSQKGGGIYVIHAGKNPGNAIKSENVDAYFQLLDGSAYRKVNGKGVWYTDWSLTTEKGASVKQQTGIVGASAKQQTEIVGAPYRQKGNREVMDIQWRLQVLNRKNPSQVPSPGPVDGTIVQGMKTDKSLLAACKLLNIEPKWDVIKVNVEKIATNDEKNARIAQVRAEKAAKQASPQQGASQEPSEATITGDAPNHIGKKAFNPYSDGQEYDVTRELARKRAIQQKSSDALKNVRTLEEVNSEFFNMFDRINNATILQS